MKNKHFLAFDLGASSGRAILGTLEHGKLSLQEVHRFVNGHKRVGESLFWDYPVLVKELKEGLKKALSITRDIAGIGIDTWGVDYVLFDASRKMVKLPYHYRDGRSEKVVEEVFSIISQDDIYRRTGIQFMPLNTLYQLYSHQKTAPEELKNACFLHMPDALGLALGGDFTTEYTDASTSNLLNPATREWDFELIAKLGIPKEIFPKIVPPCTFAGTLSPELQEEMLCEAIPIIKVGSHDTASAVGAVPAQPGQKFAYISCGTWALLGAELDQPSIRLDAQTFTNEGGLDGKIRYLANIMGCWLLQECRRDFESKGKDVSFNHMARLAENAAPCKYLINPNNALFAPPDEMVARIKKYCKEHGQPGEMDDGAVLRAIYDSLALCFRQKLTRLEELLGTPYTVLNIIGGGTQDELLMQKTSDAIGRDVVAGPIEATAIGNILAQAMTTGDVASLDDARAIVRASFPVKTFHPTLNNREMWDRAFEKFIKLD